MRMGQGGEQAGGNRISDAGQQKLRVWRTRVPERTKTAFWLLSRWWNQHEEAIKWGVKPRHPEQPVWCVCSLKCTSQWEDAGKFPSYALALPSFLRRVSSCSFSTEIQPWFWAVVTQQWNSGWLSSCTVITVLRALLLPEATGNEAVLLEDYLLPVSLLPKYLPTKPQPEVRNKVIWCQGKCCLLGFPPSCSCQLYLFTSSDSSDSSDSSH